MTSEKLTDRVSQITIDPDKKERILKLFKAFKEIDSMIEPLQGQKKDLRTSYIENDWLSNEEFSLAKKAYNALKHNVNLDDIQIFVDIGKEEFPRG